MDNGKIGLIEALLSKHYPSRANSDYYGRHRAQQHIDKNTMKLFAALTVVCFGLLNADLLTHAVIFGIINLPLALLWCWHGAYLLQKWGRQLIKKVHRDGVRNVRRILIAGFIALWAYYAASILSRLN